MFTRVSSPALPLSFVFREHSTAATMHPIKACKKKTNVKSGTNVC